MTLKQYLYNVATGLEVMDMCENTFDKYINDYLDSPSFGDKKGELYYKGYIIKVHYNKKLHCLICEL